MDTAADGHSALLAATQHALALIILDLGLPDMDGTAVIRQLRDLEQVPSWCSRPATAPTTRSKPWTPAPTTTSPSRSAWRNSSPGSVPCCAAAPTPEQPTPSSPPTASPWTWPNTASPGTAQDVRLTPTEWNILEILVRNPEKLITQQQLLTEVWGPAYAKESNYLRVYMAQLRRKLEPDTGNPRHLLTEAGIGYRFLP